MRGRATTPRHIGQRPVYQVEYRPHPVRGYFVVDPEGRVASGAYGNRDLAAARAYSLQRQADAAARRGPRACLCCGSVFESEGIHNRMCGPCRGLGDPLGAYGYQGAGAGRKPRRSSGA